MVDRVEDARARLAASKAQSAAVQQTRQAPVQHPPMESLNESLPRGAEAINILGTVRDARNPLNTSARRLFGDSDQQASSSSPHLPALPAGQTLLADRFGESLTKCFGDAAEGLEALDRTKAVITEWESRFGDANYKDKEAHARMLAPQDAKDILCVELQNSECLRKKVDRLMMRCTDLELKLGNAETYAKSVFDKYNKTHDEVAVLLAEVRAKELELLGRVEKAERERKVFSDQHEGVREQLRAAERREEAVKRELAETTTKYQSTAAHLQKTQQALDTTKGEKKALEQQTRTLEQQLNEATTRERETRSESARHADTARSARESEQKRVADVTREANKRIQENERKANEERERFRMEAAAEYQALQENYRRAQEALRKEKEAKEQWADAARRSEAKVRDWQLQFDGRIEEERAELQKQMAIGYRGIMSNIAPARRIATGDEENAPSYPLFSSVPRRRDPSPRPERPPSRGPPMEPADDNRKRQLRSIIGTALPPRR